MPNTNVETRFSFPIKTWDDAQRAFMESPFAEVWRDGDSLEVCGNTRLVYEHGGTFALIFHGTKIIRYRCDGRISLNSGGYKTATTKHRMNQFSRVKVASVKGEWLVYPPMDYATTGKMFDWDNPVPFSDHDILNPDYMNGGAR